MKTKILLLLTSILFASNAFSQVQNHGLGQQTVHGLGSQNVRSDASGNQTKKIRSTET